MGRDILGSLWAEGPLAKGHQIIGGSGMPTLAPSCGVLVCV